MDTFYERIHQKINDIEERKFIEDNIELFFDVYVIGLLDGSRM